MIEVNMREIMKKLPDEKKAKQAIMRAFTRAAQPIRTVAAKEVAKKYHLTNKQVREIDFVKKDYAEPSVTIKWEGPQIPLIDWETTQPKTNYRTSMNGRRSSPTVTSTHKRIGGETTYKTAFAAKLGSGIGIYRRPTSKRFPIKKVLGPAIPQLINNLKLQDSMIIKANKVLDKRIDHEVNRMMEK